jgi:hypothetical protein
MGKHDLLKIKPFRTCHIADRMAHIPNLIFFFYDLPDDFCRRALDEYVLYRLVMITKIALTRTLPISL